MSHDPNPQLEESTAGSAARGAENVSAAFTRLYFHLYGNSQASRAERIVSDLSLLLLLKLSVEMNGGGEALAAFMAGQHNSQESLLPLLRRSYPGLVEPQDRFGMGDNALRDSISILEDIRLSTAPAHILGDAFQAVIGPRLRGDKGQFFTPRSLVRAMVHTVAPLAHESVLDPACGTGGFLGEAHSYQVETGSKPTGQLVGIDKDQDLGRIASAMLRSICGTRATVLNRNSLEIAAEVPAGEAVDRFDVVLTNPPFGAKIGIRDKEILRHYDLAHQWVQPGSDQAWRKTGPLSASQDPQILFLELCVKMLKPNGRLGIVLPEGLFGNKRTGYIWQWLRSKGKITRLLDCPRTTFQPGTDTKTNVLFFERNGEGADGPQTSERVLVAIALACGHDRRGRTHLQDGRPYPDDFAVIAQTHRWQEVQLKHPEYLVPRYYVGQRLTGEEEALTNGATWVSLGELRDRGVLTVRKGHEVGSDVYGTGDVPFVRTSDVNNLEISVDPTKCVSETIYQEYAPQQRLEAGDVLMVVDGRYRIGTTALLTESNYRCIVQSHFRILSAKDPSVIDAHELLYALNLPSVRLRLRNLVFVQSTLGTLGNRLLELEIPLLHGDGPWSSHVSTFRSLLKARDESLARLRRMIGAEPEL